MISQSLMELEARSVIHLDVIHFYYRVTECIVYIYFNVSLSESILLILHLNKL